jgi:hypothetical protein
VCPIILGSRGRLVNRIQWWSFRGAGGALNASQVQLEVVYRESLFSGAPRFIFPRAAM